MKKLSLILLVSTQVMASNRIFENRPLIAWDAANYPGNFDSSYVSHIDQLPLQGRLQNSSRAWTDTYWPAYKGAIAWRWTQQNSDGFSYGELSREQIIRMSAAELAVLSPAEKFDIFQGRYDFPTLRYLRSRYSRNNPKWWGLCDGWANASLLHNEPQPITVRSSDGVELQFASADLKGLLAFYYSQVRGPQNFLGKRCERGDNWGRMGDACIQDVNAGAFHMVLANELGLRGRSFVMDITRNVEVWNHPITSFSSQRVSQRSVNRATDYWAAPNASWIVEFISDVTFTVENGPFWNPVLGTQNQTLKTKRYHYLVEINGGGFIVGGTWLNSDHPDFIWRRFKTESFVAPYSALNDLVR